MRARLGEPISWKPVAGIVFCGALAAAMSLLVRGSSIGPALPFMFLLVVIPIAHVWGMLSGIFAAIAAGFSFAVILFPPFGSPFVHNGSDQLNLAFFGVAAVGAARLSAPRDIQSRAKKVSTVSVVSPSRNE